MGTATVAKRKGKGRKPSPTGPRKVAWSIKPEADLVAAMAEHKGRIEAAGGFFNLSFEIGKAVRQYLSRQGIAVDQMPHPKE